MCQMPDRHGRKQTAAALLKSERGAALLLAMLVVIVLTMLGLLLLDILRNSFGQVAASEANVQAEALAQKGLDEAVSFIRQAANDGNNQADDRSRSLKFHQALFVGSKLKDRLNDLNARSLEAQSSGQTRGYYTVSLLASSGDNQEERLKMPLMTPDYPYVAKFAIQSEGISGNGPNSKVTKTMDVYVSTINRVFRYPVSTTGDLTLNGFPAIVGDVLSQGKLVYSNEAKFKGVPGSDYGLKTDFPSIKGFINANGYLQRGDPSNVPASWQLDFFSRAGIPFEDKTMEPGTPIFDQNRTIAEYVYGEISHSSSIDFSDYNAAPDLTGYSFGSKGTNTITGGRKITGQWVTVSGELPLDGSMAIDGGVVSLQAGTSLTMTNGSLYVTFDDRNLVAADLSGSITLKTTPSADAPTAQGVYINGNTALNDGFKMTGNLYVKGDLKISGSINIDGAIYVDGTVELRDMKSINADLSLPLIIVSSGSFDFSGSRQSQTLHAFLYSESAINLYGVTSELKLTGGIHGERITLNAIGEEKNNIVDGWSLIKDYNDTRLLETQTYQFTPDLSNAQNNLKSKLQIVYDNELYDYFLRDGVIAHPIAIPTTGKLDVYVKQVTFE
ncbi:hypothetical protein [Paenibacillus cymbidii]|uniref:hypothetical protein n=1 Tax=Paenibacillus cymbidii TaxID=1639034 RepID=UPI0010805626|nr:hypothetical protein [Paenibacillus cymbidii]